MVNIFKIILIIFSIVPLKVYSTNKIDKGITEFLAWEDVELSDRISDYGQITLMASPFVYSFLQEDKVKYLKTSSIVTGVNYATTSIAKYAASRIRPNGENNRSFWSGHSSSSFTGAALLCGFKKRLCAPAVGTAGLVAYLRVAARKHWFTDTLIGAYVGYAGGIMTYNLVFRI